MSAVAKTKIEWATDTWNPVTGCDKVSQGCKNCYAEREWTRLAAMPGTVYAGRKFTNVQCHRERLTQPLKRTKPRRIFVNSMSDLFHDSVSWEFIDAVFGVMAVTTRHTYQILTKRPKRMRAYLEKLQRECENLPIPFPDRVAHRAAEFLGHGADNCGPRWPLENVWLGVSAEDQATWEERSAELFATPAALRWVSAEPLLGPIDIGASHGRLDWVVAGGESGPEARMTQPDWLRSLRDQCASAEVPFFFKQWGEWAPCEIEVLSEPPGPVIYPLDESIQVPEGRAYKVARSNEGQEFFKAGKKLAGHLLDGIEHYSYPAERVPAPERAKEAMSKTVINPAAPWPFPPFKG
jgi:protein gp37